MNKFNFKDLAHSVQSSVTRHSPEILLGIGIGGMITTVVVAVKSTPKALELIDEEKEKKNVKKLSYVDTVKVAYKPYIPAFILGASSIACLIGSNSVSTRRTAAFATAYKISETALSEYKNKVVETIGETQEKAIRDEIAKDRIESNPVVSNQVIITEKGNTLCFDSLSGRYFKSDIDILTKAQNELNRRMINDMYVSLNEFYVEIGLDPISIGNKLGWNTDDKLLELDFSSQLAEDGTPCLVMDYNVAPKYDYDKFL